MTPAASFCGRAVALFGLGGSGLSTARALMAGGARVAAWDDGVASRQRAGAQGVTLEDLTSADWSQFAALVLSPGVPLTHPVPHWTVRKAKAAGVEIIGDVELFCRERARLAPDAPFVAITGANGKSTTTALIAHILREAGHDVQLGGNIGTPILDLAPPARGRVHVIECSSFQIDLTPGLRPSVGVLLNVTPDHIDRHGTLANYAAVKERLVAGADHVVIGVDDDHCRAMLRRLLLAGKTVTPISQAHSDLLGCAHYAQQGLHRAIALGVGRRLVEPLASLVHAQALRGAHNGQNAAAAFSACEWLGVNHGAICAGLASFPGLPHRMEEIARFGAALFINDSKATNADAAEKALLSYDDVFWIIGGKAKDGGIESLRPLFPRVRKAYLIGAASDEFAATLGSAVAHEHCGMLEVAIERAAQDALACDAREPVVLLSPACASYDQFANFEMRGNAFRDLVRALVARLKKV
jgi:UDP-N-acetylmuramoylalanine--D-glutamate ligase